MSIFPVKDYAAAGLLLSSLVAMPVSAAESLSAAAGEVEANYVAEPSETFCAADERLVIKRQGETLLDIGTEQLEAASGATCLVFDLAVQDLDSDREPEVIVDIYSGGAHCCTTSLIYRYGPAQGYQPISHFWGNGGYRLQDLNADGSPEFVSTDDAFAYAFTSYAGSQYAAQIWQYQQGQMQNVSRAHPAYIYDHAFALWQRYSQLWNEQGATQYGDAAHSQPGFEKAVLAAYLADKYLLGQAEDGWQRVRAAYHWPDREVFFAALEQFLIEEGYVPGSYAEVIEFEPDRDRTAVYGQLAPEQSRRYLVSAQAGQSLTAALPIRVLRGTLSAQIVAPNGQLLGRLEAPDDSWQSTLPVSGSYTVELFSPAGAGYGLELTLE
ncbi:MAG: hypothetical protein F6J97_22485 [Leptolyngbya sp. SIO4C1]|nr:hypothetical protein [Leptolyngbya sp. SIO4C1]